MAHAVLDERRLRRRHPGPSAGPRPESLVPHRLGPPRRGAEADSPSRSLRARSSRSARSRRARTSRSCPPSSSATPVDELFGRARAVSSGSPRSAHQSTMGGPRCSSTCASPPGPPERCWVAIGPSSAHRRPGPDETARSRSATEMAPATHEVVGLAPERRLEAVDHVPGQLGAHPHRPPTERRHQPPSSPSTASSDVSRPPTTSTSGTRCGGLNGCATTTRSGCRHASWKELGSEPRRAAGEHDVGRRSLVEGGEERALEVQPLRTRLDDEVGASGGGRRVGVEVQPVERRPGRRRARRGGRRPPPAAAPRPPAPGHWRAPSTPWERARAHPAAADRPGTDDRNACPARSAWARSPGPRLRRRARRRARGTRPATRGRRARRG